GHVENFFLQDCSMEVVHTVAQRDLRERQSEANPIRCQVLHIIEVNTAYCEIAQLLERGGALDVGKDSVGLSGLERKRNKSSEPGGFILQLPYLAQMIRPMSNRFHVSVVHRACAADAHRMPRAMQFEPCGSRSTAAAA